MTKNTNTKNLLSPKKAITENKRCSLQTDHVDTKHFWMMIEDNSITIAKQTPGNKCEIMFDIPRKDFNRFIEWYQKPQRTVKRRYK